MYDASLVLYSTIPGGQYIVILQLIRHRCPLLPSYLDTFSLSNPRFSPQACQIPSPSYTLTSVARVVGVLESPWLSRTSSLLRCSLGPSLNTWCFDFTHYTLILYVVVQKPVHLLNNGGEQHSDEYKTVNPMEQVPS